MTQHIPNPVDDINSSRTTSYVGIISFTILVWDHIDTFADEVEYIWKKKKNSPIICLFLFNRYFTPLAFIVQLYAYMGSAWTKEMCDRFVKYEGVTFALNIYIAALMMMLRVKALYPGLRWLPYVLTLYILGETAVSCVLIARGEAVEHNPFSNVKSCTMIFDSEPSQLALSSASAWMPLFYDSVIFALTIARTLPQVWRKTASHIVRRLLEDGILYYAAIFGLAFTLVLMIVFSPPGIRNITAQTEQLVTVTMMSRITLNLKKAGKHTSIIGVNLPDNHSRDTAERSEIRFRTVGTVPSETSSVLEVLPPGQKDRRPSGSRRLPADRRLPELPEFEGSFKMSDLSSRPRDADSEC